MTCLIYDTAFEKWYNRFVSNELNGLDSLIKKLVLLFGSV